MKSPLTALTWIAIPVAAAAGFLASRHHSQSNAAGRLNISAGTPDSATSPTGKAKAEGTGFVARWTDRLTKATAADLPALYTEIQGLPDKTETPRAMLLLCARWAEVDAAGALAFFAALGDKNQKDTGRRMILTEWATHDPLAAYAIVAQQPEAAAEAEINSIGYALLNDDPDQFWIWFKNARKPLPMNWNANAGWITLAAMHFDELSIIASEMLTAESKSGNNAHATGTSKVAELHKVLAAAMAEKDPDKSLAWSKALPESVKTTAITGALEVLAKVDPDKVVEHLSILKARQTGGNSYTGGGADALLKKALTTKLKGEPLAAVEWLNQACTKLSDDAYPHSSLAALSSGMIEAMSQGKITPEQAFAAARAAKESGNRVRIHLLSNMWKGMPVDQLAATANWLTTIESRDAAKMAIGGIFTQWITADREGAMQFALQDKNRTFAPELFERLANSASAGLVSTQGERMANTFKIIPAEYRAEIMEKQLEMRYDSVMMDHSGPFDGAAVSTALEGLPTGPATEKAYTRVATAWGATDPEAALTWAGGQSDSALRKSATGAAVEAWAKEDAWGTSQWINALPPGETRDTASHHLARALRGEEPVSAWSWAGSIGDPATRLEAQSAVLREWHKASSEDAAAAVQGVAEQLAPADHQRLLEALTLPAKAQ